METPQRHIIDDLKKNPQILPDDDYFASLKAGLMEKAAVTPVVPLYRRKWLMASAAAAAILILIVVQFGKSKPQPVAVNWDNVSQEELLAYIDDNIADFDAATIAAHLDSIPEWHSEINRVENSDVAEIQADKTQKNRQRQLRSKLFDELNDEEILEYLEEEVIELDDELLIGS